MATDDRILVLGIGNILWADEGFGVRAVERLRDGWVLPPRVTVLDGGTQGLYLLPHLEEADALIVLDAIDYGLEPGTLRVFQDADVPAFLGAKKMSLHQTGFQEVLATAALLGRGPRRLVLVGVQPQTLEDFGGGLTAPVAAQLDPAVALVLSMLATEFAVAAVPAAAAAPPADPLSRDAYEAGRPDAAAACRIGDARVLARALR